LIGQVIDTNSAFIADKLGEIGIRINRITSVSDRVDEIISALNEASNRVRLILITGGLGPTNDDRTKTAIEKFFGSRFIINEDLLNHIKQLLRQRGVSMNDRNTDQAKVPDNCRIIPNRLGTAPGMWFEKNNCNFIFMPGVPFEMKAIIEDSKHELQETFGSPAIIHKTILTHGIAESALARSIQNWENDLPAYLSLAYLPSPGMVRLRISGNNTLDNSVYNIIDQKLIELKKIIPDYIFGYDSDSMEKVIGDLLLERNATLSIAESCTGGYISSLITGIPGSSRYFIGSITAYSNEVKNKILMIDNEIITQFGAVSKNVAEGMAEGVRNKLGSQYSIATTGIAGPEGGSAEKPVGTVWIAIAGPSGVRSKLFRFGDERNRNIVRSSYSALNELRMTLLATS
jgi:nicotinamide-nucleotide amidase